MHPNVCSCQANKLLEVVHFGECVRSLEAYPYVRAWPLRPFAIRAIAWPSE